MSIKRTLGGDRLGAEKKMSVELKNFGRSSSDVSKVFRSDQAVGTLVPAWCQLGTTGTTFYSKIRGKVRTLPTNGPIFGSFKQQVDVFVIPIRLYIAALHNNALGVGLKMSNVKLPMMKLWVKPWIKGDNPTWSQVAQDSLIAYTGIRGLGANLTGASVQRSFQALFQLAYWDIYKNYYANKQEEIGFVITSPIAKIDRIEIHQESTVRAKGAPGQPWDKLYPLTKNLTHVNIATSSRLESKDLAQIKILVVKTMPGDEPDVPIYVAANDPKYFNVLSSGASLTVLKFIGDQENLKVEPIEGKTAIERDRNSIALQKFDLETIDEMRSAILAAPATSPFYMEIRKYPYRAITDGYGWDYNNYASTAYFTMQGLGVKTYLADMYNNWLSTEWIDGDGGIADLTKVDTMDGSFTIDALILSKKLFDMLNRIAVSGGSYNDWQEAVYGVRTTRMTESPIYVGGMASEIVFDEVVSNSATADEALGSLAGRGKNTNDRSNDIKITCEEPSIVMAITSITPRIDYSQGNKWWTRLETMDDLHKPSLDAIGFQELLTDEICASDTRLTNATPPEILTKSLGKTVSWVQYMTDVNETFGDFAAGGELEWMAINRQYEINDLTGALVDGTTYIDPQKYNYPFADAKLSAKNFWVQIAFDATARRVMSAKQIPNL